MTVGRCLVCLGASLAVAGCGDSSQEVRPEAGVIVVQRSIGKAELGMSAKEIRAALGAPRRRSVVTSSDEPETGPWHRWHYPRLGLSVDINDRSKRVTLIETTRAGDRTPEGIGVGSTEAALGEKLDGFDCHDTNPGERWCTAGGNDATQTTFVIHGGRVTLVRIVAP